MWPFQLFPCDDINPLNILNITQTRIVSSSNAALASWANPVDFADLPRNSEKFTDKIFFLKVFTELMPTPDFVNWAAIETPQPV